MTALPARTQNIEPPAIDGEHPFAIIVDDVTYERKGNYNFLTITLDKVGGIDLEMIVHATGIVDKVVDSSDITDDSFIMDVVSKERG